MFARLFRVRQGRSNVALENFTTEALRTAIEDDPILMIRALRETAPSPASVREAGQGRSGKDILEDVVGSDSLYPTVGPYWTPTCSSETLAPAVQPRSGRSEDWALMERPLGDPGQLTRYRNHLIRRSGRDGAECPADSVGFAVRVHPVAVMGKALGGGSIISEVSRTWLDFLSFLEGAERD